MISATTQHREEQINEVELLSSNVD